jgi:hypothetical protein
MARSISGVELQSSPPRFVGALFPCVRKVRVKDAPQLAHSKTRVSVPASCRMQGNTRFNRIGPSHYEHASMSISADNM